MSEYFNLGRTQPFLDFVDVPLDTDVEVFVDPSAIKSMGSTWGHECASLIQNFFETVLRHIQSGNNLHAQKLLSSLNERNEFHLGFSTGKSRGHGFGTKAANSVWQALSQSQASISGLLKDLEDTCLLIHGIGTDMLSDAVCNIIRGPLLRYTQDMCGYYDIPMVPEVASGPIWNASAEEWEQGLVPLPMTEFGKVVFVPKIFVRHRLLYQYDEYYRHYLLPEMQQEEISANSGLVEILKNGEPNVTKKSLMEKYGADKLSVVRESLKRPHILEVYKKNKDSMVPRPLSHKEISEIEQTEPPDWKELLSQLKLLATGLNTASKYEDLIEKIFSALFYPALCNPKKQKEIHKGRKRIDITYMNEANHGFFYWASLHYSCAHIFVECKNFGKEVGNPEVDQLSGRFSPSRGQIGILVCRNIENRTLLMERCVGTAKDQRGFIIPLDDKDLEKMIDEQIKVPHSLEFTVLREIFDSLVS